MTDPIERELKTLLDDRGRGDPLTVQALAESIATLPARRSWGLARFTPLAAAAAIVVIAIAAIAAPRFGGIAGRPTATPPATQSLPPGEVLPGGPEAFAGDPRLGQCSFGNMEFVFLMEHARDYPRYMPRMGLSPELDIDAVALVVVFSQDMQQPPTTGFGPGSTNEPGHRYVCVVVDGGDPNLYSDVDITGLTIDVDPSEPMPTIAPTDTPLPTPTPPPSVPAADLIRCSSDVQPSYGDWWSSVRDDSTSPELALGQLTERISGYLLPFPTDGYVVRSSTRDQVVFTIPNGEIDTAAVVVRLVNTRWAVVDFASCQPSEWPIGTPNGANIRTWTDASGAVVPTSRLLERNDCYQGEYIRLDGQMFVRDVSGDAYDPGLLRTTYLATTTLPADAVDTGLRDGQRRLYLDPDGSAAFVADSDSVERLPRVIGDDYQRIDCN
jgi:hypothetical protein